MKYWQWFYLHERDMLLEMKDSTDPKVAARDILKKYGWGP